MTKEKNNEQETGDFDPVAWISKKDFRELLAYYRRRIAEAAVAEALNRGSVPTIMPDEIRVCEEVLYKKYLESHD